MTKTTHSDAGLKARSSTSAAVLLVDHGTNFSAKPFLHALYDRIGHGAATSTGAVCGAWGWRLRRCRQGTAHHPELQRPAGCRIERSLNHSFRLRAERDVYQHLRDCDLHGNFKPAHRPLAFFQVV